MSRSGWGDHGRRWAAALACLGAGAVALAGCGGSTPGTVSARAYVTSVCKAIGPFEHEIASGSAALDPSATSSAAQRKRMLEGFLTTIASDSRLAVGELKAAKRPNVANGAKIAREFVSIFARIDSAMQTAAQKSKALPTGSATAFRSADKALGAEVEQSVGGDLGSGESVLRNRALETAAASVAACHPLG